MKFVLVTAAIVALAGTAVAAPRSVRLRGTITGITAHHLTLKTTSGATKTIMLVPGTHYLKVEKSSLTKIDPQSYIGTATKKVGHKLIALEVVIFPPAMRGVGEGHYAWDRLPDPTRPGHSTSSMMTNGTVTAETPKVSTTMTNGTVAASNAAGADKRLTVTYKGGQQTILVPPSAPIVTFKPGSKAIAVKGARVFIKASETGGTITAQAVAVGVHGVTPPM